MTRVTVSGRTMQWALARSNLTDREVSTKFPGARGWMLGTQRPTLRQLEEFAKATRTPLGFLFLDEPPDDSLPIPHFRTLGDDQMDRPSPDLLETVQAMQRRQEWMREYLTTQGHSPLPFVHSARPDETPVAVAQRMHLALGFGRGWAAARPNWTEGMHTLCQAMEDAGVLTVINGVVGNNTRRKLDVSEFRGFVLADEYAPLVFVNGRDAKAAQMFTLAHELAHVYFGVSAAFDLREMQPARDPVEQACNHVAAEFLVPEDELRSIWSSLSHGREVFEDIARHFKVSRLVAARRALDLDLIRKDRFLDFYRACREEDESRASARRSEGGNFYATQNFRLGRRFATAVVCATQEGQLTYTEAYRLTGLHGATLDRYATSLGLGEAQ